MTTKIKWRLANRPTPKEVSELFSMGILTKDEAREILFSLETDEDRDKKSLEEEIKFLRSLVQSLSNRSTIVEHIYQVQKPYISTPWYQQYQTYCSSPLTSAYQSNLTSGATQALHSAGLVSSTTDGIYQVNASNDAGSITMNFSAEPSFTEIKTF